MRYKNAPITQEAKADILKDNEKLFGSMNSRAIKLAVKYHCCPHTICAIIRHTITKIKRNMTDDERQQIRVLYSLETGDIEQHKFKRIGKQVGFSAQSVRNVIKAQQKEETRFFNPKEYSYYD